MLDIKHTCGKHAVPVQMQFLLKSTNPLSTGISID